MLIGAYDRLVLGVIWNPALATERDENISEARIVQTLNEQV